MYKDVVLPASPANLTLSHVMTSRLFALINVKNTIIPHRVYGYDICWQQNADPPPHLHKRTHVPVDPRRRLESGRCQWKKSAC